MFRVTALSGFGGGNANNTYMQNVVSCTSSGGMRTAQNAISGDPTKGIISAWFDPGADTSGNEYLMVHGATYDIDDYRMRFYLVMQSGSNDLVFTIQSSTTILVTVAEAGSIPSSTFQHLLIGWDAESGGANEYYVYLDDSLLASGTPSAQAATISDADTMSINERIDTVVSFDGQCADYYYAPGQYLDFSDADNRRKFIDGRGNPVDLGADGSTPTATAPLVFKGGAQVAADWNAGTNLGTGADFTDNGSGYTDA